jgi:L-threonylcarbamoyladenylate synthase
MKTERYRLGDLLASPPAMSRIADRLMAGQVGLYPTETIYGIGGRADSPTVKERIFEAKERPRENPLIAIASAPEFFDRLGAVFPAAAQKLAASFWPGRLTLVLPVRDSGETVAVRTSDHPFIIALFRHLAVPILSTSANLSGRQYHGSPDVLWDTFNSRLDFMIDAGELPASGPSTVVRVFGDSRIEIVREGVVSAEAVCRSAG